MDIREILDEMEHLLVDLSMIDLGYPIGTNIIHARTHIPALPDLQIKCASVWLTDMYGHCDGFSFPDIRNGYFLYSLDRIINSSKRSDPTIIAGDRDRFILTIGSMGGGDSFAIDCDSGIVMLLSHAKVIEGRYYPSSGADVIIIANTLELFLYRVLLDMRAFITNDCEHKYIA